MALGFKAAFEAVKAGGVVMVTHPDPTKAGGKVLYSIVQGSQITEADYYRLRRRLKPRQDGLFLETSQTFEWNGTEEPKPEKKARK